MSDIANLSGAVADLKSEVGAIGNQMDANFAALQAALNSNNTAAIQQATADIRAQIDALKAVATRDTPAATP